MSNQKISYPVYGARVQRVLDALTPLIGVVAPAEHADFIGQLYVDTVLGKGYMAVATDSASAADDWKEITLS